MQRQKTILAAALMAPALVIAPLASAQTQTPPAETTAPSATPSTPATPGATTTPAAPDATATTTTTPAAPSATVTTTPAPATSSTAAAPATPAAPGAAQGVTMTQAIETAVQAVSGSGVIDAELEDKRSGPVYEIEVVAEDSIMEVQVDGNTGEVLNTKKERLKGLWMDWFRADRIEATRGALGTLSAAIETAESTHSGQVVEVSLDEEKDQLYWDLELKTAAGEMEVMVDTATGSIIASDRD
ncbi:PepSY domain-containing protein [Acuticoccus kandeliae]|uniref:PepSY domain-containing protein n=1 Tax=Acuticoccus kandeliae TaxID=2073160 RepID=UPI00147614D8|nr:PepSY domain-containing protein [Acuticoccus kandeliae]